MSKFCANCGAEVSDGFAFCEKCGTPVQAPENQAPSYNNAAQYAPAAKQESNGMAIGGFVCSLVGLLLCCGGIVSIIGLILSIIGLSKSKQMNGSGKGLAIAGIIIGAIGVVVFILTIILYAIGALGTVVESNY